jgi:hypothetical protein
VYPNGLHILEEKNGNPRTRFEKIDKKVIFEFRKIREIDPNKNTAFVLSSANTI